MPFGMLAFGMTEQPGMVLDAHGHAIRSLWSTLVAAMSAGVTHAPGPYIRNAPDELRGNETMNCQKTVASVSVPLMKNPPPPPSSIIFSGLSSRNWSTALVAPGQLVKP